MGVLPQFSEHGHQIFGRRSASHSSPRCCVFDSLLPTQRVSPIAFELQVRTDLLRIFNPRFREIRVF